MVSTYACSGSQASRANHCCCGKADRLWFGTSANGHTEWVLPAFGPTNRAFKDGALLHRYGRPNRCDSRSNLLADRDLTGPGSIHSHFLPTKNDNSREYVQKERSTDHPPAIGLIVSNAMTNRTKRQHIVPRFYLSRFCSGRGMVWTYCAGEEPMAREPKDTAVETNFYSPIDKDGECFDETEEVLAVIEAAAAPLWEELMAGQVMGERRKSWLCSWQLNSFACPRRSTRVLRWQGSRQITAASPLAGDAHHPADRFRLLSGVRPVPVRADRGGWIT